MHIIDFSFLKFRKYKKLKAGVYNAKFLSLEVDKEKRLISIKFELDQEKEVALPETE